MHRCSGFRFRLDAHLGRRKSEGYFWDKGSFVSARLRGDDTDGCVQETVENGRGEHEEARRGRRLVAAALVVKAGDES